MYIHFVGIGGTLMGHLAVLACQMGHKVSGSDQNVYPPMSNVLATHNIDVKEDWDMASLASKPDMVVLGNAGLKRGNPAVEYLLRNKIAFMSGAQWLGEVVLRGRWVLAVSGTHGKTTTASILAWILDQAGHDPGFLIGGVPRNFSSSARLGGSSFFVVEADEYDTSFFDRRAKFLHYYPRTLIINNLEYDHADIYASLEEIQNQFHLLLRQLPDNGLLVMPNNCANIDTVVDRGCWSNIERFEVDDLSPKTAENRLGHKFVWQALNKQNGDFEIWLHGDCVGVVQWSLSGSHNQANALSALAAAHHAGVSIADGISALRSFTGVLRRMENLGSWGNLTLYDDFAHHPTAIEATLSALRLSKGNEKIVAFIDSASHTMKRGDLLEQMANCTKDADMVVWMRNSKQQWHPDELLQKSSNNVTYVDASESLVQKAKELLALKQIVNLVCISNGSFENVQSRIIKAFQDFTK